MRIIDLETPINAYLFVYQFVKSELLAQMMHQSVHRAKGSEAKRVFHLSPELCPHPKAVTDEQKQQESNAMYVAITRAELDYIETIGKLEDIDLNEETMAAQFVSLLAPCHGPRRGKGRFNATDVLTMKGNKTCT